MSAPYPVGSRVVCPDPDDGWFIGTVAHIDGAELTIVYSPTQVVRARAGEVRPVMPRDRADLERWGRWWWRDGQPVFVTWMASGPLWSHSPGWPHGSMVSSANDWRGPVQPPPVVRG